MKRKKTPPSTPRILTTRELGDVIGAGTKPTQPEAAVIIICAVA
jgi:hypothetical protein